MELKKDNNNTFFSYIYGDFCIKYMLALDLSGEPAEVLRAQQMGTGNAQNLFLQALDQKSKGMIFY